MVLDVLAPNTHEAAELDALASLLTEFDSDADSTKVDYLKHRYAGFTRKESATLAGVKVATSNKWLKDDPRMSHFDDLVNTEKRKSLRKEVLQESWGRNFYLVLKKDEYILRKAHGLLEEPVLRIALDGSQKWSTGSPQMTESDWDYYKNMRKTYTPESWKAIEATMAGQGAQFNIATFILNQQNNAT